VETGVFRKYSGWLPAVLLGLRKVPESKAENQAQFDRLGDLMAALGFSLIVFALIETARASVSSASL
jgi:hypothetical protein